MSENCLRNYEILFLYTLLKKGYNGEIELDFEFFHNSIIEFFPYILEFFINKGLLKDVKIKIFGEDELKKDKIETIELMKGDEPYMKIFNKYAGCNPFYRRITFSFSSLVNLEEIKKYCLEYLHNWENDNISLEYVNYLKPSIQLKQFSEIISKEIEQRGNNFRYNVNNLEDLDEVTLIFYFYIKGHVSIRNDCVNIINGSKNIWFNLIVNNSIYEVLNKYIQHKKITDELYYNDFESVLIYKGKIVYLDISKQTHALTKVILRELSTNDILKYGELEELLKKENIIIKENIKDFSNDIYRNIKTNKDIWFIHEIIEVKRGEGFIINKKP